MAEQRVKREDFVPELNPIRYKDYTAADVHALRATAHGKATPEQQIRAVKYWIEVICETYDEIWRKDPSQKDVAIGRRAAGLNAVWVIEKAILTLSPEGNVKQEVREAFEQRSKDDKL